jgi:hypothetical protein
MAGNVRYFARIRCGMMTRVVLLESRLAFQMKTYPLEFSPQRGIFFDGPIGFVDGNDSHDKESEGEELQHGFALFV